MQLAKEKIELGHKTIERELVENTIQGLVDLRALLAKIVNIINTPHNYIGVTK